jgi:hypothetical protein
MNQRAAFSAFYPLRESVTAADDRAGDTLRELVSVEWEHAFAVARAQAAAPGSPEHLRAHDDALQLAEAMVELEQTLLERPWTEA